MRRNHWWFFLIMVLAAGQVEAQTVVQHDTLSGTPLSMSMDKKISALLTGLEDKCNTTTSSSGNTWTAEKKPRVTVPERELSRAEICRRNPRIMGYKIQLAVVKSNAEAREIGLAFRRRFPNMKVEIDASLRPNYKVMAGSYLTKQSIASDLSAVRSQFKGAIAVQYRVFCAEAK